MNNNLALYGGTPVRKTLLPYGRQKIDEEDINAVVEVLKSDYVTCGPAVDEFEKKVAEYVGARYAVAVNSGTAALHAACFAAGIKPEDEAITTPMTFAASSNCVLYMGGKPVFADILPNTYNIDPDEVRKKITQKTRAIIPVDFTGQTADLDAVISIARENNLVVIEDAAHALGADYKGRRVGSISDMTIFSFHPVKHITTGEGGMVTTDSKELYEKLKDFRTHGITRDPGKMHQNHGPWYYEMQELGYNYRITDIQTALGSSQMNKLSRFLKRRREIVGKYNNEFSQLPEIVIPYQDKDCCSAWHLYIIRLRLDKLSTDRKTIFEALRAENIGVNVHYVPVYYHPYYKQMGYNKGLCPKAEELYEGIITLPLHQGMNDNDVDDVVKAVRKVTAHFRK